MNEAPGIKGRRLLAGRLWGAALLLALASLAAAACNALVALAACILSAA